MRTSKLIQMLKSGRVLALIKPDAEGKEVLVGFERSSRSRKSGTVMLRQPIELPEFLK